MYPCCTRAGGSCSEFSLRKRSRWKNRQWSIPHSVGYNACGVFFFFYFSIFISCFRSVRRCFERKSSESTISGSSSSSSMLLRKPFSLRDSIHVIHATWLVLPFFFDKCLPSAYRVPYDRSATISVRFRFPVLHLSDGGRKSEIPLGVIVPLGGLRFTVSAVGGWCFGAIAIEVVRTCVNRKA